MYYENIKDGTIVEIIDSRKLEIVFARYYKKNKEPWQRMMRDKFYDQHIPTEQPAVRFLDKHWNCVKHSTDNIRRYRV